MINLNNTKELKEKRGKMKNKIIIRENITTQFKKWWKRIPYWLKGGVIGSSIPIVFFLAIIILNTIQNMGGPLIFETTAFAIIIIFIFINSWLGPIIELIVKCSDGEACLGNMIYPSFVISIFEFFVIGALISWIINKYKRNKNGK